MSKLTREAWMAYFKGDYARAADLYKAAGEFKKASEMYGKDGNIRAMAEMLEAAGEYTDAVELLLKGGDPNSAALILEKHGQFSRAASLLAEAGNKMHAAAVAQKGGNILQAAQYLEQAGRFVEAGRLVMQGGYVDKALLLFEKALKAMPSLDLLTDSEQLQNREMRLEIARYFEEGQDYLRAASIYESLNEILSAAQCWEAAKNYSKAVELYKVAGAPDRASAAAERGQDTHLEVRAEALAMRGESEEAARLFLQAGKKERAAAILEETGNLAGAAELRREMGDYELAGNLFYRIQSYMPAAECFQQARLHALAKQCYLQAGDNASACRMAFESGAWEEAVELAPGPEDKEALIERLQTLPEKEDDQYRLRVLKARLFVDLGQPQVALTCLEDLKPSQGEEELWRLYSMGRAYEAIGRAEQASAAFKKVMALNLGFQDVRHRMEALSSTPALREDRFRRQGRVGEDEFGTWYKGYDTALRTPVLLHFLDRLNGAEALANDQAFLRGVVGITHPSVLTLRDVGAASAPPLLIYEDFEGQPLTQWLGEGYKPSTFAALDKLRQILEALVEANKRGASHQGLSPSSILMDKEGRVKIQGFGLRQGLAHAGVPVPPPPDGPYGPPSGGAQEGGAQAADLYSAGILFLYLLTGEPPVPGASGGFTSEELTSSLPPELNVPPSVQKVLQKMLAADTKERYAYAEDALREISAQELPPGSVIAGRYEILEELGRGGMGQVFRVKDRDLDEVIALKTLRNRPEMSEASRARFLREIKLTRKITHPNVIRVFDLGAWRDMAFLTMEYIPGKTLSLWVREGEGKKANLRQKVEILRGIAAGLQEAHKLGIIHRDLKPQNVILTPGGIPKLLDFGIAHAQLDESAELTQEGHFVGSPKYVSPEQIQGLSLSVRSDIYCFGLLAYFLLTGQDAFTGDTPLLILLKQLKEQPVLPSRLARLPPRLENLILTCLQKKPEDRPESLEEVSVALKEIV